MLRGRPVFVLPELRPRLPETAERVNLYFFLTTIYLFTDPLSFFLCEGYSALAWSLRILRRIFPLVDLGIASVKMIPPSSLLYGATLSLTHS
jgi:hypothetical protein